jgi:excisionase family DNA binding protein
MSYTAIEAARELGVSEKTIRRWVEDGKLQARRIAKNRLAIAESEIARLQMEREQSGASEDSREDQAARLEDLERKYSDLERRLAALEARDQFTSLPAASISGPGTRTRPARDRERPAQRELFNAEIPVPPEIPDGSLQYADFANMHGMNPYTFRDHLTIGIGRGLEEKDRVPHFTRPIPNRREVERWLSPEQQYQAILFWQRHGKKYISCPACPHKPLDLELDSVTPKTSAQEDASAAIGEQDQ